MIFENVRKRNDRLVLGTRGATSSGNNRARSCNDQRAACNRGDNTPPQIPLHAARCTLFELGIAFATALALSATLSGATHAQTDGTSWLEQIDAAERVPHSFGSLRQTITTSGGSLRTFTIRSWSGSNGDVSLMVYDAPARVAGDKILMRDGGDNIWYYMKRRDVTRHFVGHTRRQSAMGSDFSYEDLAQGDLTEDYTARVVGEEEIDGEPCVKLRAEPTPSGPSYEYLFIWASVNDHLSRRIEYYDDGNHVKTLFLTEFRDIEGRITPMTMEMVNHREGSRTLMEQLEITFAEEPDPSLFTQDALTRRIRSRK